MIGSSGHDGIDWNEVWRSRMETSTALKRNRGCSDFWDNRERAKKRATPSAGDDCERVRWVTSSLPVTPGSRVLDIGAGTGAIAIPLALRAAAVTAVEPAQAMRDVMERAVREAGIDNITVVGRHWEETDLQRDLDAPYDIVFASFSLGMPNLKEAIERMNEVCSGTVAVFHFAGLPYWEQIMLEIWPRLHGVPYFPGPKADVIFNLLYRMGIYPNVSVSSDEHRLIVPDLDAGVDALRGRLLVGTPEQEDILREYLAARLVREDGGLVLRHRVHRACIRWEPHRSGGV
ncbi:class I SAM-dependent methyltransferase [Methanoculleus sp. UBA303]|jgi:SAM-dependent methyltransferase|uniref:class I SAM-dependent methyltransferase n=1 Tax=Methanoculleus sp. UBA303 TaxID=1915497 RepID=UPI0025F09976|nr:class I SAM-dependent methyltransferase [Methanoculleus sp. UBA303]MDD3933394.1 class I SAM-dependent methyltransferase [Methanoculleus sp.]